jgi:hypothetical protein
LILTSSAILIDPFSKPLSFIAGFNRLFFASFNRRCGDSRISPTLDTGVNGL